MILNFALRGRILPAQKHHCFIEFLVVVFKGSSFGCEDVDKPPYTATPANQYFDDSQYDIVKKNLSSPKKIAIIRIMVGFWRFIDIRIGAWVSSRVLILLWTSIIVLESKQSPYLIMNAWISSGLIMFDIYLLCVCWLWQR